ncbi:hypothetical protein [Metallosphaera javensis (ex Sakai et al. 2022)]|uniref:hypothetical protein n=1 Tax=Metallosphaera javensis (ex Sakai et al. 2022) TaxID=2775498 RepID=UPI0025883FC1|nr:MAG: hypothetical protein MjAS7_1650 [Metallosphaera javensis (ex Sakai et al. 2022)]
MEWKIEKASHKLPRELIRKMEDYLIDKYAEDIIEIGEFITAFTTNENLLEMISEKYKIMKEDLEFYNSIIEHNTVIGEYKEMAEDKLGKLIDGLRKNQDKFVEEASQKYSGVFIISYYTLYLRLITRLYLMLKDLKIKNPNVRTVDSPEERKIISLINAEVFLFAIPILVYLRKGKVMGEITTLQGIMLYLITQGENTVNPNSLGHRLFLAVFND